MRPVPWSRLGWVVWRRYRTMLIATLGVLVVIAVYLVLSVVLLPFAIFDRRALGLLASGIASELVLVVIAPTTDWRYSYWLLVTVVFAVVMLVARRMNLKRLAIH